MSEKSKISLEEKKRNILLYGERLSAFKAKMFAYT